jgi:hypothetical protein
MIFVENSAKSLYNTFQDYLKNVQGIFVIFYKQAKHI